MHSFGRLVVAVVAEGNCKTILLGILSVRSSEHMVYLDPTPRVAYIAPLFFADD
jgi:hypothetical protein